MGVRVLFLSADPDSPLRDRIAGLGGAIEVEAEVYSALSAMIDDPMGYGLFVMECDGLGGIEAGARAAAALAAVKSRVPVILISRDYSPRSSRRTATRRSACARRCRRSACGSALNTRCATG